MPAHDLDEVKRLARDAASPPELAYRQAVEVVMDRLDLSDGEARAFILAEVTSLTLDDFAETLTAKAPPADVYGIQRRGCGWYVKVAIKPSSRLVVISFHPPALPLRTRSGTIR